MLVKLATATTLGYCGSFLLLHLATISSAARVLRRKGIWVVLGDCKMVLILCKDKKSRMYANWIADFLNSFAALSRTVFVYKNSLLTLYIFSLEPYFCSNFDRPQEEMIFSLFSVMQA